ncbi:MAG: hypothetical protein IKC66_04790, partial [Alistipes sp.]|nr:hypothetical protein [Alistipes sp.]
EILKKIVLYALFLIAMVVCATAVIKIYDLILDLDFENIWKEGFKAGFAAWIAMLAYIHLRRKKR